MILGLSALAGQKTNCPTSSEHFEMDGERTKHAVVGKNVTLPCISKNTFSLEEDTLEWSVHGDDIYAFKNRIGKVLNLMYKVNETSRISISDKNLKKGNASIQLSDVKTSDSGTYCCCIVKDQNQRYCTNVTLVVDEGSPDNSPRVNNSTNFTDTTITAKPTEPADKMNWMKYVTAIIIVIIGFMVLIYNVITITCFLFQRQG